MPEGDTIHHAANRIRPALRGEIPEKILTPQARHAHERWPERLAGRAVRSVDAYGKHLFLRFEGDLTLHSHLRMTGAWSVYGGGQHWKRSPSRAWLVIRVAATEVVQFDGPVLELMSESRIRFDQRLAGLGPDILGESFDERSFMRRLREDDPSRPIGDALLNQRTVAGIGNLWKAEACFGAGVDPWRQTGQVQEHEAIALLEFARERMGESAREGFQARPRAVYKRAGMPCPRCATRIRQRGQGEGNRLTFWCPGCQR
jgi:endonuclease VIII